MTNTERQAKLRASRAAQGLVPLTCYVPKAVRAEWQIALQAAVDAALAGGVLVIPVLKNSTTGKLMKGGK